MLLSLNRTILSTIYFQPRYFYKKIIALALIVSTITNPMGYTLDSWVQYACPELFDIYAEAQNPNYVKIVDEDRFVRLSLPEDKNNPSMGGALIAPELGYQIIFSFVSSRPDDDSKNSLGIQLIETDMSVFAGELNN